MDINPIELIKSLGPSGLLAGGLVYLWKALQQANSKAEALQAQLIHAMDDHRKSLEALLDRYHLWVSTSNQTLREIANELDPTK